MSNKDKLENLIIEIGTMIESGTIKVGALGLSPDSAEYVFNFNNMTKTDKIKKDISKLSDYCLLNSGIHRNYSDEDLSNAFIILVEVLLAKIWDYQKDKLTQKQLDIIVKEAGKILHKTTLLFSGVDLHKIYK